MREAKVIAVSKDKKSIKVLLDDNNSKWLSLNKKTELPKLSKGDIIKVDFTEKSGKNWINKVEVVSPANTDKEKSIIVLSLLKTACELVDDVDKEKIKATFMDLLEIYKCGFGNL